MVQGRQRAEVGLAHIHGRHGETASDGDEQQPCHNHHRHSGRNRVQKPVGILEPHQPQRPEPVEIIEQECYYKEQYTSGRHSIIFYTSQSIGRRCEEVEERCSVEFKAPVGIKNGVEQEYESHQQADKHKIDRHDSAQQARSGPHRGHYDKGRNSSHIAGKRQVERKAMPHHLKPLTKRHTVIRRLGQKHIEHEQRLLNDEYEEGNKVCANNYC